MNDVLYANTNNCVIVLQYFCIIADFYIFIDDLGGVRLHSIGMALIKMGIKDYYNFITAITLCDILYKKKYIHICHLKYVKICYEDAADEIFRTLTIYVLVNKYWREAEYLDMAYHALMIRVKTYGK
ncbi:hypothetical protein RF11_03090 [Thelohanellus kitauei]|uniref:Uncharacterized protein n=1 Tax=Thelohanellus kitauei TaxID=669202 RepID=A0A0C2MR71_THEKT|nr:hypothetical protein RF11_03090 [Thelohanellus kitauei]